MVSSYITRGNTHAFWHAELSCSYRPTRRRNRIFVERERQNASDNGLEVPKEVRRVDSANLRKEIQDVEKVTSGYQLPEKRKPMPTLEVEAKKATAVQVLKFLLSDAGLEACRSDNENEDVQQRGKDIITYSQLLSPFEELFCAVVLSRQIPRQVGLEAIRTVLNQPYGFRNPVAIKTAGPKKVLEAFTNTQHTDKTADEIELIAEAVSNNNWHNDLMKLRRQTKSATESEREVLRRNIKGLGKNGLDTFYRRIQWLWKESYPFVDSRTQVTLEKLGLPKRPEGIVKMIEVRWDELKLKDNRMFGDEEKRRRAFVMLLERALSADMEGRIDDILEGASKLS